MKAIKKAFKEFWNNNHVSDWEWEHYNSKERREKYPQALPPIGSRDMVLCFIAALLTVLLIIIFLI